ncbi:MAG: pyridoxal phosphate-dependent aminotransferase [bacterium]
MAESIFQNISEAGTSIVMQNAVKLGFSFDNTSWVNFGQGAPELGIIDGDLPRIQQIDVSQFAGYAPASGTKELRQKIADYYNQIYRSNKTSKYSFKNVSVTGGGRNALMRVLLSLDKINFGFLNPDYTAYKGQLDACQNLTPKSLELNSQDGFKISTNRITDFITKQNIQAFLFSNPCNPTGQCIVGDELEELVKFAAKNNILTIIDEFYSRFVYPDSITDDHGKSFSSSSHIEDVNKDPILIIDGFTKGWRYPGFRLSWIIGPEDIIDKINAVASFLDGGAPNPLQNAVLELLDPTKAETSVTALKREFNKKRLYLVENLLALGFKIQSIPQGAFYIYADISSLPKGLNTDLEFTQKMLENKLIVIPGRYFDLSDTADTPQAKFSQFVRFSYGCSMDEVKIGVEKLREVLG